MLPALITMDLLGPLLAPEHLSLIRMAIWQSSLPTTLSNRILWLFFLAKNDKARLWTLGLLYHSCDALDGSEIDEIFITTLIWIFGLLPIHLVDLEFAVCETCPFLLHLAVPVGQNLWLWPNADLTFFREGWLDGGHGQDEANAIQMRPHFQLFEIDSLIIVCVKLSSAYDYDAK